MTLPGELAYFARTASLVEGIGTRHDPHFNAIEFSAPIALRMRARIMASLRDPGVRENDDWTVAMGGLLGEVAGVVRRAGREVASIVGSRLLVG